MTTASMIAINGRFLCKDFPTGTHRSSYFLMSKLCEQFSDYQILCPGPPKMLLPAHVADRVRVANPLSLPSHVWEQCWLPRLTTKAVQLNLIGTAPCFTPSRPMAMVVHDVNYHLSPESFDWRFRAWYRFACGKAARGADTVLAVSQFTKQTLVDLEGVDPEKIHVFRQGPGLPIESLVNSKKPKPEIPIILCVGSLQPHKNLPGILDAFDRLLSRDTPPCKLVVVGKKQKYFNNPQIDPKFLSRDDIEFSGYISDDELGELYQQATMFVYPSFEEGFGMPLVEAFYAGCPVITSNQSCLPEIAGDAACLVSPSDSDAIASAMHKLLCDEPFRGELIHRGLQRAKNYSWQGAADTVLHSLQAFIK